MAFLEGYVKGRSLRFIDGNKHNAMLYNLVWKDGIDWSLAEGFSNL